MCATKQARLRNDSMTIILPRLIVKIDCAVRGKKSSVALTRLFAK